MNCQFLNFSVSEFYSEFVPILIFNSISNTSFTDLVQVATDDQSNLNESVSNFTLNNNFISASFHDDFFNSAEIIIALFNKSNKPIVELRFRGVNHFSNWFQAENIISSSLWDISQTTESAKFDFGFINDAFEFQIIKNASNAQSCEKVYFEVECDLGRNKNDCLILYANSEQPVLLNSLKSSRSIAIYGRFKNLAWNSKWPLIFRYSKNKTSYSLEQFFWNESVLFDPKYKNESGLFKMLNFSTKIFTADCSTILFHEKGDIKYQDFCLYNKASDSDEIFNVVNNSAAEIVEIFYYPMFLSLAYPSSCNVFLQPFLLFGVYEIFSADQAENSMKESCSGLFRYTNFDSLVSIFRAAYVKMLLLDENKVVQTVIANVDTINGPMSVYDTSSWNLTTFAQFNISMLKSSDPFDSFSSIFQPNYDDCSLDFGFMFGSCNYRCPKTTNISQTENAGCKILYTPKENGDLVSNFKEASKVEFYFIDYFYPDFFHTVFRVDAFCGIDIYKYFRTGIVSPAHDGIPNDLDHSQFYRHPELFKKLYGDATVRLLIYDFEGQNVVQENAFNTQVSAGGWINISNWHPISFWNEPNRKEQIVHLDEQFISILTFSFYDEDIGYEELCDRVIYFSAVSVNEKSASTGKCPLKSWWRHEQVLRSGIKSEVKYRPPAFFYSDEKEPLPPEEMKLSGKIEVQMLYSG